MEKEKNKNLINNYIKYESKTARYSPMVKKKDNIINVNKSNEKEDEKIISEKSNQNIIKGKNSIIKKKYLQSLLKSSSTSRLNDPIKNTSPIKSLTERNNSNKNSPKKKNPFQNNYIQFQSSINNINQSKNNIRDRIKVVKRSNSYTKTSNKLHKGLMKSETNVIKNKKDLKNHPFLSRLSLKPLETVQENIEIEENEEFSVTTSASNTPLKDYKNFSFLNNYSNNVSHRILDKKKIIKKKFNFPPKIIIRNNTNLNSFENKNIYPKLNHSFDLFSKTFDYSFLNKSGSFDNEICNDDMVELVNIEDLIIIEEKYKNLQTFIFQNNCNLINKSCLEWWNYYFSCSFKGNLSQFFIDKKVKSIIEESNTFSLLSILILYEFSYKPDLLRLCLKFFQGLLLLNNKNFLLICNNFLSKIQKEYLNSIWVEKLKLITQKEINNKEYYINQIDKNMNEIYEIITIILSPHKLNTNIINVQILEIYNNYSKYSHEEIHKIFLTDILKINNKGGSILYSNLKNSYPLKNYIIKKSQMKPLTLFLDLDETLISFIYKNENEGLSRIRPFLFQFLNMVKNYYELIIFTAATRDYADPILDCIEETRGNYFSYRLYRESCTILNNYYVKDISKFGIDLSKTIIVDNMAQNFKLQKENGILISSFWGEDIKDDSLYFLGKILVNISMEMIENKYLIDIRKLIFKYREEILCHVSLK